MVENWWGMEQMLRAREREIRLRMAQVKPWTLKPERCRSQALQERSSKARAWQGAHIMGGALLDRLDERHTEHASTVTPAGLASDSRLQAR